MRSRLATLTSALLVPTVLGLGAAPALAGNGNNGTVKIAEADEVGTPSNDPHVSCSFAIEWYGYDEGSEFVSTVSFESQAPTADATISVTGSTSVFVGGDAAGGGTDLDAREVYTLSFTGTPHPQQGFHVKVTTTTPGSQGSDHKFKTFWVQPCQTGPTDPTDPGEGEPPVTTDPEHPTTEVVPWTWDWQYAPPACDALTVDYPANIPSGQANDVNIRFETNLGELTLNFHNNDGTWSGRTIFTYAAHPQWPAGVTAYRVVWVQVGGTNYHWQGSLGCGDWATPDPAPAAPAAPAPAAPTPADPAPADPAPAAAVPSATGPEAAPAAARLTGFRSGAVAVRKGAAPRPVQVTVVDTDAEVLQVQRQARGSWTTARTVRIAADGSARVTFPRLAKRGTYQFRVVVDGVASKTLRIRVR